MGTATALTTVGTTIASATFGPAIMAARVSPLYGAAMAHTGATTVSIDERLKLIPYESLIGLTIIIVTTITWGIIL